MRPVRFMAFLLALILPAATAVTQPAATMKAVVLHEYGAPELLKYEDAPRPEPKENELLVRVIACGVNPADPLVISGRAAKEFGTRLPLIPGYDVAGVVEKTGAKVTKFKAAAVPLAALTAWQALLDTAKLSAGQTALIHGGSGGVG